MQMDDDRPIYLLGSTSIVGWNLYLQTAQSLTCFCNSHVKLRRDLDWQRLNLEDEGRIKTLFVRHQPRLLIYCGGVCDVEKCEQHPKWAYRLNVRSLQLLLSYLPNETRLVYCSSDHVFSGDGIYTENSFPNPIHVYGQNRVAAENLIASARNDALVLRFGLPVGPSYNGRSGHLDWLRYRTTKKLPISIVRGEYRSAVWAEDLAKRILALAKSKVTGLRHIPAAQVVSRIELATYLMRLNGDPPKFKVESREERSAPHIGHVELKSIHNDSFAKPLSSPIQHA